MLIREFILSLTIIIIQASLSLTIDQEYKKSDTSTNNRIGLKSENKIPKALVDRKHQTIDWALYCLHHCTFSHKYNCQKHCFNEFCPIQKQKSGGQ